MKIIKIVYTCFCFSLLIATGSNAQKSYGELYDVKANAVEDISHYLTQAKEMNKHVILQVGGNWCSWCYKFHDFIQKDSAINKIIEDNYLIYHLNYSKENKNEEVLASYRYPQRFGFPVFVILDANGNQLHVQDSALLESGDGYDVKKVRNFFRAWTPAAVDPETYK